MEASLVDKLFLEKIRSKSRKLFLKLSLNWKRRRGEVFALLQADLPYNQSQRLTLSQKGNLSDGQRISQCGESLYRAWELQRRGSASRVETTEEQQSLPSHRLLPALNNGLESKAQRHKRACKAILSGIYTGCKDEFLNRAPRNSGGTFL